MSIGERVKQARMTLGISQDELAIRANSTQATISSIENGRSMWPKNPDRLAAALGVDLTWLLCGEPPVNAELLSLAESLLAEYLGERDCLLDSVTVRGTEETADPDDLAMIHEMDTIIDNARGVIGRAKAAQQHARNKA